MKIQLSDHFTYQKLLRFTISPIIMMIFTSLYTMVDGLFVSNFVGKTPFAALNLIYPLVLILGAFGFMLGTGGSALVAKTLGEGKQETANQYFSMLVYTSIAIGIFLAVTGQIITQPVAVLLGAKGDMLHYCVLYGRILSLALPAYMLQYVFQSFLITAEKPKLGLLVIVLAGVTNMALDYVFIVPLDWGLAGAAAATGLSQCVAAVIPLIYFFRPNSSCLRLGKTKFFRRVLGQACLNGSSEMVTNIAASIITVLYNFQLMRIAGEDGISAYGIIAYATFIISAIFLGYAIGSAPIFSYHYGAENHDELKSLLRKSLRLIAISCVGLFFIAEALALPLSKVFVGYDQALMEMTCHGFQLYAFCYLISGFNIFGSAFFTALNNGPISATISFLRTLVFETSAVIFLPMLLGLDGVWLAIVFAESMAFLVTIFFLVTKRKRYHYF